MVTKISSKDLNGEGMNVFFALDTDTILNEDGDSITCANGNTYKLGNADVVLVKNHTSNLISAHFYDAENKTWGV